MKTFPSILALGLIVAAFIGGLFYGRINSVPVPQHLTLEQILSIKELHLVKHTYNDLFFIHRKNDKSKAIRAIAQVPVTITAYLNLKDAQIEYHQDSIKKIILPRASMHEPVYEVNKMVVRETRSFQVHAGKDLYPLLGNYFGAIISERIDTARNLALTNRILIQAEAEGKEYIDGLLRALGRTDIVVSFGDDAKDKEVADFIKALRKNAAPSQRPRSYFAAQIEDIPFGFLPF